MSDRHKPLTDRAKQQERAKFDRGINSLMRHLEELRPVLSNEDLDDQSINKAREIARAFVVSESGTDAASHIYKSSKDNILKFGREGGFYHTFPDEAYFVWQTADQSGLMGTVLNTLVMLAQNSVPTRRRRELAQELRNRASDFVEVRGGEPWNLQKSDDTKAKATGVSSHKLQAAFEFIKEHGPVVGKNVARHIKVDEDAFRGRYVRQLKAQFGIQNERGKGYFAP